MQTAHRSFGDVVVLTATGRIDYLVAADFERALLPLLAPFAGSQRSLILDLADVEYISSVGLRVLMIATKTLRGGGARLGVASLQPAVREIFAVSRFDRVVEIFPSVEAALAAFSPAAASEYARGSQARSS